MQELVKKQRYSRGTSLPYANGGIPRVREDDAGRAASLTEAMSNLCQRLTSQSGTSTSPHRIAWRKRLTDRHYLGDHYHRGYIFIRYVRDMLKQPSKYDWWESGEITPKLLRQWWIR